MLKMIFGLAILFSLSASAFTYGAQNPVNSLSPFADSNMTQWEIHKLVYDFLLIEIPGTRDIYRAGLAKSWTISKDKKIFDFELRPAQWSDGKPVTVEDVKFSLEHILDAAYKSPWKASFAAVEKIEILSSTKIRISSKFTNYEQWKNIAVTLKILPKHFYQKPSSSNYNKQLLGSGPYKLTNYESAQIINLEKNPLWWGWQDAELKNWFIPEKISFQTVATQYMSANYLQKNKIDIYPIRMSYSVMNLKPKRKDAFYLVYNPNKDPEMLEQIFFNLKNPLFEKKEVRIALNQLVDRANLCTKFYGNKKIISPYQKEKALAALKKAGWVDSNKDGVLDKNLDGKLVSFEFEILYNFQEAEPILTFLKENFKGFGIRINLKSTDNSLFWNTLHEKLFNAYFDRQDENETVLDSEWQTNGYYNNQGFSSIAIDKDLDKLDETYEVKSREKLIKDIRQKINSEATSLQLCYVKHEDFAINSKHSQESIKKGIPIWGWFK
ncbi:MAG: ABC transporter substrate-binding protein [Bdellovibrio sp.]|nr:ABC transporter substrate-binding protein [Bdellovibrio sp.]